MLKSMLNVGKTPGKTVENSVERVEFRGDLQEFLMVE